MIPAVVTTIVLPVSCGREWNFVRQGRRKAFPRKMLADRASFLQLAMSRTRFARNK